MKFSDWFTKTYPNGYDSCYNVEYTMEDVWDAAKADSREVLEAIVAAYYANGSSCTGMKRMVDIAKKTLKEIEDEP